LGFAGVLVAPGVVVPGCDGAALVDGVAVGDAPGCDVLPHAAAAATATTAKTTDMRDERIAPAPCDMVTFSCWRYER
jgi:hypothetical protein